MWRSCTIALGLAATVSIDLLAQAPAQGTPAPQIKGQTPVLGRPTRETDPVPIFDFDTYFLGRWAFEVDVPDTDLGPGGTIKGTTTYRAVPNGKFDGGAFYEARTTAFRQTATAFHVERRRKPLHSNRVASRHLGISG